MKHDTLRSRASSLAASIGCRQRLGPKTQTAAAAASSAAAVTAAGCSLCLRGSLAQCALSLKRLSAGPGPGFNPQTWQNKLSQDY